MTDEKSDKEKNPTEESSKKPEAPKTPVNNPVPTTPAQSSGAASTPPPKPVAAKPVAKPVTKPAAGGGTATIARPGSPASAGRRGFVFSTLGLAWTGFALATAGALGTVGRFLFPNVLFEPKMTFKAGKPDEYEIGKVDTRFKDQFGVWIVRGFEGMYVLSTVCTHLGCPPAWQETEQKFKCPCHGSGFYKSGINFEGPAPRPLERYRISLADDGQVLIDKSKKFQQEKGEWENPESFLVV